MAGWMRLIMGMMILASGCSAPAPSVTAFDSRGPAASIAAQMLDPSALVWLAGRGIEINDVTVAVQMTLARGDGTVLWRDQIDLESSLPGSGIGFVAGPSAGVLAFGVGADVHVVSSTDPHDRVVATASEPLVSGSIDPSGDLIYLATQPDANTLRISRLPAHGGEREQLADLGPEFVPNDTTFSGDLLRWTPDGSRLLIQACGGAGGCWWDVMDVASGEVLALRPAGAGTAVGVTNDTLLAHAAQCAVGPCPFVLVDLARGDSRQFDPGAHEARTALAEDGATVILFDNQGVGGPPTRITAFDPALGTERVVYESAAGLGLAREGQGGWAPPGWFVVAAGGMNVGEGGTGPVLVRIADGLELRLPGLPPT